MRVKNQAWAKKVIRQFINMGPAEMIFHHRLGSAKDIKNLTFYFIKFLDKVQVLDPFTGAYLSSYGEYGTGPGQLNLPTDIVIDDLGRTVVTEARNKKVEVIPRTP